MTATKYMVSPHLVEYAAFFKAFRDVGE